MLLHRDKNCILLVLFSLKWANFPYCSPFLPTPMLSSPFSSFLFWNNQIYWIDRGTINQGNICKEKTRKKHGKEENRSKIRLDNGNASPKIVSYCLVMFLVKKNFSEMWKPSQILFWSLSLKNWVANGLKSTVFWNIHFMFEMYHCGIKFISDVIYLTFLILWHFSFLETRVCHYYVF